MSAQPEKVLERHLKELVIGLVVQFILGVALTTVIAYDPAKSGALQTSVLWAHILLGLMLLTISILFMASAYKLNRFKPTSWWGMGAIIVAFAAGGDAAQNGHDWAVFVMALGFIAAIAIYGKALGEVRA